MCSCFRMLREMKIAKGRQISFPTFPPLDLFQSYFDEIVAFSSQFVYIGHEGDSIK